MFGLTPNWDDQPKYDIGDAHSTFSQEHATTPDHAAADGGSGDGESDSGSDETASGGSPVISQPGFPDIGVYQPPSIDDITPAKPGRVHGLDASGSIQIQRRNEGGLLTGPTTNSGR